MPFAPGGIHQVHSADSGVNLAPQVLTTTQLRRNGYDAGIGIYFLVSI